MDASSYTAGTGDRVFAARMAGFDDLCASTLRNIIAPEERPGLEADGEDVATGSTSNITWTLPPAAETCYVKAPQLETAFPPGTVHPYDFYVRVLSGSPAPELVSPEMGVPQAPRSDGSGCRVIRAATAKEGFFAITVNSSDTIGVIVRVDLERGAPEWNVLAGIGGFTGFFIITL
jgi:hypothetical protein